MDACAKFITYGQVKYVPKIKSAGYNEVITAVRVSYTLPDTSQPQWRGNSGVIYP